jgi:hypothetical protein
MNKNLEDLNIYDRTDLIGYTDGDDGYLYPIYAVKPGRVTTRAFILCHKCNATISTVDGPNHRAVCLKCFKERKQ